MKVSFYLRFALLAFAFVAIHSQAQKIDLNGNGVSDIWEQIYGASALDPNADTDGDGVPNRLEAIAGTDPFDPSSFPQITVSYYSPTQFMVSFPSQLGKQYQLESVQPSGPGGWTNWTLEATSIARKGTVMSLSAPISGAPKYFRIAVADLDTDGDGVNDWEEYQLGLDPNKASSNNQLDSSGHLLSDYAYATNRIASQNLVTITATDPVCVQPDAGQTAQDFGQFTITRGGFPLSLLIVNVQPAGPGAGMAIGGQDYTQLGSTVSLPPGVSSAQVSVRPLPNTNLLGPVVATLNLMPGPGYRIGTPSNASVVIYPSSTPSGTGLTGQYFTNASASYSNTNNFSLSNSKFTRTDPTIDFIWGNTTVPFTNNGYYCVRWTGQVQPQYSETYYFVANTDDGVKLWVNDQLIIDNWIVKSASDSTGSINLQAGVRYNIRMEYFQQTGSAVAHLNWYSASQPKQIIPSNRLYPSSGASSVITSPISAVAFLGQPFNFTVTGANSPVGYTAAPLPPGLGFNSTNGSISGIPNLAGTYQIMLTSSNSAGIGASVLTLQVIDTGSSVVREVWVNALGSRISDIPLNTPATATNTLGTLEGITNYGVNYGERVRGFFTAPATANYHFWISGSDNAELWISNDSEPANKVKRASATTTGFRQWNLLPAQRSSWLSLVAGERYYLEVLHKAGSGGSDHWSVGWLQDPSGTNMTPAGVVPGYLLSRYYQPPPSIAPGTLYIAQMLSGNGVTNMPYGSATLRLNADNSQGVLNFSFDGISSTIIGEHIDNDPFNSSPSLVLYDISATHPQPDGSYLWSIEPAGTLSSADVLEVLREGKAYITILTHDYPDGELIGHFTPAQGSSSFTPPDAPAAWIDDHADSAAAARFLIQATYGPSPADVANVQTIGYTNWLNNQFATPATHHLALLYTKTNSDPTFGFPGSTVFNDWWQLAVTAPDQLRQRVAFALSEILVVSDQGVLQDNGPVLTSYYDKLLDNAFGNFRDLLKAVTLTPAMGLYLNMQGNDKGNIVNGTHANENYAREIMQLFSIGLYRLWPDGTLVMTTDGNLVPTYDQNVIMGFAATFTGWNYYQTNQANGRLPINFSPNANFTNPMVLVPNHHDLNTKLLLDNVVLPQAWGSQADSSSTNFDLYCSQDLELALDNIFYNQNVGPFICRQLIQRLVTSHPSPAYLYRVVQAFNDNGSGVRGDLQAVVRAILLDFEARSSTMLGVPSFGKQREPLMRVTAVARAFPAPSPVAGTYFQDDIQFITNTTVSPHRLGTGDTVMLTYSDGSGQPAPATQSYPVTMLSPTVFRVTSAGLASGTYNQTNATITNMLTAGMVTTNIFMVNISGHGLSVGNSLFMDFMVSGTYSLTNITFTNMLTSSMITTNVLLVNAPGHGLALGDNVTLRFTSGGAADGLYQVMWRTNNDWFAVLSSDANRRSGGCFWRDHASDGVYQVMWTTNNNWFAVIAPSPNQRLTNNCFIPKLTGGGFVVSGHTTVTYSTPFPHGLNPGDSFLVNFTQAGNPADGIYQVVSVPDATHFTFNVASVANQTQNSAIIYPLVQPRLVRSGNATISWNTWNLNATDTGGTFSLAQTPLNSPTVFNFFFPEYKFPGILSTAGLTTPEFQLTSDTTVAFQMNFLEGGVLGNTGNTNGMSSFNNGGGALVIDLGPWMTQANTSNSGVPGLVDSLSSLLCGSPLTAAARTSIINYATSTAYGSPPTFSQMRDRVRAIVHLIINSPEYTIQR